MLTERLARLGYGIPGSVPFRPVVALAFALLLLGCTKAHPAYLPRDKTLASLPIYFYPSQDTGRPPKATVFFFGNDVGFWEAHQQLAEQLSAHGYSVIGFDVKKFLDTLPVNLLVRDSVFAKDLPPIIARALHELKDDGGPIVLAGHSFGADVALWSAAGSRIPGVVGVLALGPTPRSHLKVTPLDLANMSDPRESGSFAAADEIRHMPAGIAIAILRGSGDKRRATDESLVAASGSRIDYRVIPFAGHSLKSLTIAGPMIESALDRLVAGVARISH